MERKIAGNTFEKGLVMDFNPISTPNNVMTSSLNATILTFNGNEYILQTDMGNGRVETACLPAGYIPVGMVEFGGIIYVASYSPELNRGQIGSFPSPERNISTDEISELTVTLNNDDFNFSDENGANTLYVQKNLYGGKLTPGDKYIVYAKIGDISNNANNIIDCPVNSTNLILRAGGYYDTKAVEIYLATITDDGKIVRLGNKRTYPITGLNGNYIIAEMDGGSSASQTDLDSYRSITQSPFNIFDSKVSGNLLLVAELVAIDNFSVSVICQFDDIEGGDNEDLKNVQISAIMTCESDNNVFPYAIQCEFNDSAEAGQKGYHAIWDVSKYKEDNGEQNSENRTMESLLTTIEGYDSRNRPERSLTLKFTPCMTWGPVTYLSKNVVIQLDKIGSGFIELYEWRYFVENSDIILGWALNAYPEEGFEIAGVRFIMSCVNRDNQIETIVYNVDKKKNYSGSFTETIPFDSDYFKIQNSGQLKKNRLYYVTIEVQYQKKDTTVQDTSKYRYFYRWLYTCDIFNSYYISGDVYDFNVLIPDIALSTLDEVSLVLNGNDEVNEYNDPMFSMTQVLRTNWMVKQYISHLKMEGSISATVDDGKGLFDLDTNTLSIDVSTRQDDLLLTVSTNDIRSASDELNYDDNIALQMRQRERQAGDEFPVKLPNPTDKPTVEPMPEEFDFSSNAYQNDLSVVGGTYERHSDTGLFSFDDAANLLEIDTIEYTKAIISVVEKSVTYNNMIRPVAMTQQEFSQYALEFNRTYNTFQATLLGSFQIYDPGGKGNDPFLDAGMISSDNTYEIRKETDFPTNTTFSFLEGRFKEILDDDNGIGQLSGYPIFCIAFAGYDRGNKNVNSGSSGDTDAAGLLAAKLSNSDNYSSDGLHIKKATLLINKDWSFRSQATSILLAKDAPEGYAQRAIAGTANKSDRRNRAIRQFTSFITCMRLASDQSIYVPINMVTGMVDDNPPEPFRNNHFNYIAMMLIQLYYATGETGATNIYCADSGAYINRIVTDFMIGIRVKFNITENTKVYVEVDNPEDGQKHIDEDMRKELSDANHAFVMNTEENDPNNDKTEEENYQDINRNIDFNFTGFDENGLVKQIPWQSQRLGDEYLRIISEYIGGQFSVLIRANDGTVSLSQDSITANHVYGVEVVDGVAKVNPINRNFKLHQGTFSINPDSVDEESYLFRQGTLELSDEGALANKFVMVNGKLYIDDSKAGNTIGDLSSNSIAMGCYGNKAEINGAIKGWSLIAPIKDLKAYKK